MAHEPYQKNEWEDGENKFNITDQDGNIILENIKVVYVGAGGSKVAVSKQKMERLETQYDKAKELVDTHKAEIAPHPNMKADALSIAPNIWKAVMQVGIRVEAQRLAMDEIIIDSLDDDTGIDNLSNGIYDSDNNRVQMLGRIGDAVSLITQGLGGQWSYIRELYWRAQTFTPTKRLQVTRITLSGLRKTGSPPIPECSIYTTSGGKPNQLIATGVQSLTTNFNFSTPVTLEANTQYAIVINLENNGGNTSNYWEWERCTSDVYPEGNALYSSDGGATWTQTSGDDMKFTVIGYEIESQAVFTSIMDAIDTPFTKVLLTSLTEITDNPSNDVILQWEISLDGGVNWKNITPDTLLEELELENSIMTKLTVINPGNDAPTIYLYGYGIALGV